MIDLRLREVDGADDAADIAMLHELTFDDGEAPLPDTMDGHRWLVWHSKEDAPIAFAGVVPSDRYNHTGYYNRVGVLPIYRGLGLQRRLTRAIEARCRRNGWSRVISDTTDNLPSANNFIRAGYCLFAPQAPWAFPHSLYWRKML